MNNCGSQKKHGQGISKFCPNSNDWGCYSYRKPEMIPNYPSYVPPNNRPQPRAVPQPSTISTNVPHQPPAQQSTRRPPIQENLPEDNPLVENARNIPPNVNNLRREQNTLQDNNMMHNLPNNLPTEMSTQQIIDVNSHGEPSEVVSSAQYIPGFLRTQLGKVLRVEFLIGDRTQDRVGTLVGVGSSYIILQITKETYVLCDIYSIKFVNILEGSSARYMSDLNIQ